MTYTRTKKGFTLVEVIIYTSGALLIIGAISTFLYYSFGWYRSVAIPGRADQIGQSLVDRLEKDIRAGKAISNIVEGTDNGSITLTLLLSSTTQVMRTYAISNGRITVKDATGPITFLTPADMNAAALSFKSQTSSSSSAVRFNFSLNFATKDGYATSTYDGYAVLRNSYK